jgi:hypothetical protein
MPLRSKPPAARGGRRCRPPPRQPASSQLARWLCTLAGRLCLRTHQRKCRATSRKPINPVRPPHPTHAAPWRRRAAWWEPSRPVVLRHCPNCANDSWLATNENTISSQLTNLVPLSTQVLYGSVTGNAEEIARQLAASARDHGVQSELQSLEKYKKVRACVRACVRPQSRWSDFHPASLPPPPPLATHVSTRPIFQRGAFVSLSSRQRAKARFRRTPPASCARSSAKPRSRTC